MKSRRNAPEPSGTEFVFRKRAREAVAGKIECDHPEVPGQLVDPRVPRRQGVTAAVDEYECGLAVSGLAVVHFESVRENQGLVGVASQLLPTEAGRESKCKDSSCGDKAEDDQEQRACDDLSLALGGAPSL